MKARLLSRHYLLWTCVSSLVYYIKIVKSIKERCPTETDQIELAHDFRESVSVYLDRMRIGKNYTFMATEKGFWIVDTQKIVGFSQEHIEGRTPTTAIYIDLDSDAPTRRLFVTRIGDLPEISVGEQIQKAKSVLRQMHGEQGED